MGGKEIREKIYLKLDSKAKISKVPRKEYKKKPYEVKHLSNKRKRN